MKKILVVQGNPRLDSFCGALADAYAHEAAQAGAEVKRLNLSELSFDPILREAYLRDTPLEPDLQRAQQWIQESQHLVFVYPVWWGSMPALLKGFVDRTFLPGFAFKYRKDSSLWDRLLVGRSARMILTMDAPLWYNALIYRKCSERAMKAAVLEYSGIKPVRVTAFGQIRKSTPEQRDRYLSKVAALGAQMI